MRDERLAYCAPVMKPGYAHALGAVGSARLAYHLQSTRLYTSLDGLHITLSKCQDSGIRR